MKIQNNSISYCAGTKVLMANHQTQCVEHIVPGDLLMGPDFKPRTVTDVSYGRETSVRITPKYGEPMYCNTNHILVLKAKNDVEGHISKGQTLCLSVKDYLGLADTMSAEGYAHSIISELYISLQLYYVTYTGPSEPILGDTDALESDLRKFDMLLNNIPVQWYMASRAERELILARIIDYHFPTGTYDYQDTDSKLCLSIGDTEEHGIPSGVDDVIRLCRGLGFAAYTCVGELCILGDFSTLDCLRHDTTTWKCHDEDDYSLSPFSLDTLNVENFYGFSVLGSDKLYLLQDHLVMHGINNID